MKDSADSLSSLTRSSSTAFTPLPVSQSRLPVARTLKRPSSPAEGPSSPQQPFYNENFYANSPMSSPSKHGRTGSGVADIVKQRLFSQSLTPSPLKTRSAATGGIFSSSSAAQSTRRLSLGGSAAVGTAASQLNAYGIRSDLSPRKSVDVGTTRRRSSLNPSSIDSERIKVCVRKRPLSEKEVASRHQDILEMNSAGQSVAVLEDRVKLDGISKYIEKHEFRFDRVFDIDSSNRQIYASAVQQLVDTVISGGRATCFAYGQTGSGKTHTMLNPEDGLNHLAARDLFAQAARQLPHVAIHVTFYEIYQNTLYDLFNDKRRVMACEGKGGEVHIVGIKEVLVSSPDELHQIMLDALNTRSTGSTAANSTSSRSHAILQFILKKKSCGGIHGKFSFIDLAGSERGSDRANVDKQTKLEGAEINKSLLALKECIRAIDQDSSHLPFRQSKLTLVLKDSFTGNAKTCMIATVSPSSANCEHTINTLRYADRVKELKGPSNLSTERQVQIQPFAFPQAQIQPFAFPQAQIQLFASPIRKEKEIFSTSKMASVLPKPSAQPTSYNKVEVDDDDDELLDLDEFMNDSSPLKLTESDDSFLLSAISSKAPKPASKAAIAKLKEAVHHSIAILYDRVSNCCDVDQLELLGEELEGLLAAFNK